MNPVNLCMLIVSVIFASVQCSPFKVEDEFDNDFAANRDSYDDRDSSKWDRSSMRGRGGGGRRMNGRELERSGDNDFREVSAGGEDEASEELASRNNDFERDENGRMKGRGDDEDEERPFMKEDDGVPDRYVKIKKAAQEDAVARSRLPSSREQGRRQESHAPSHDEKVNVESDGPNDGPPDGSNGPPPSEDSPSAPVAPSGPVDVPSSVDDGYPRTGKQDEYDGDAGRHEPHHVDDSPSGPIGDMDVNSGPYDDPTGGPMSGSIGGPIGADDEMPPSVSVTDEREGRNFDMDTQHQLSMQPDHETHSYEPEER